MSIINHPSNGTSGAPKPTHVTFISPSAPIGSLLDRLKQVDEELVSKWTELGQIRKALTQQRAMAYQSGLQGMQSATALKQEVDAATSNFSAEEKEYEADIEALKVEQVYIHSVLKYLHGHD